MNTQENNFEKPQEQPEIIQPELTLEDSFLLFKPKTKGSREKRNLKHLSIISNNLPPLSSLSHISNNPMNPIKPISIAKLIRMEEQE